MPFSGKKRFNENFRPLRSKINLKISPGNVESETVGKKINKVTVKQSAIDEFDRVYAMNCDQKLTRKKNRNVSYDSPFDPANKPPAQHLLPENVLEKPGKIDLKQYDATKIPLAGRMGELGKLILERKMAKHISTGPFGEEQFKASDPRTVRGRFKPGQQPARIEKIGVDVSELADCHEAFENVNFGFLHKNVPKTTKTTYSSVNMSNVQEMKNI